MGATAEPIPWRAGPLEMLLDPATGFVRLTQALRLLRETRWGFAEIATSTGFSDQSYLDRRLRRTSGKTPRQYREEVPGPVGTRHE